MSHYFVLGPLRVMVEGRIHLQVRETKLYGPFKTFEIADQWAAVHLDRKNWIMELEATEDNPKPDFKAIYREFGLDSGAMEHLPKHWQVETDNDGQVVIYTGQYREEDSDGA